VQHCPTLFFSEALRRVELEGTFCGSYCILIVPSPGPRQSWPATRYRGCFVTVSDFVDLSSALKGWKFNLQNGNFSRNRLGR
jgi:hypothetical protein